MRYVLGDPPEGTSDAFDALENVFGSDEFTRAEAAEVLVETLDLDSDEAQRELNRLARNGTIEEA